MFAVWMQYFIELKY